VITVFCDGFHIAVNWTEEGSVYADKYDNLRKAILCIYKCVGSLIFMWNFGMLLFLF